MDRVKAAVRMQAVVRRFLVRVSVVNLLRERWEKAYDPKRRRYYYFDTQQGVSKWRKPRLLWSHDITNIAPAYQPEHAAILIQRQWRAWVARLNAAALYGATMHLLVDEQSGCEYWYNPHTGAAAWELPQFMTTQMKARVYKAARGDFVTSNNAVRDSEDDQASSRSDVVDEASIRLEAAGLVRLRKQPRSKMQGVVDRAEDAGRAATVLDVSGFHAARVSSRIWALDHLRALDLSHNSLEVVPVGLVDLTNLEELNLSHNRLREVPEELGELGKLTKLSLSKNQLLTFPANLYCLANLTSLDVSHNTIQRLPCEVGNLELLKVTQQWEVGIGLLQKLIHFDASHNELAQFPLQMDKCRNVVTLELAHNKLKCVPEVAEDMSSLQLLDLSYNDITDFDAKLDRFSSLRTLKLRRNQLDQLPRVDPQVAAQLSVQVLDAAWNRLSALPDEIVRWSALTSLDLSHNKLERLPAGIGELKSLKTLNLSHNRLASLPPAAREMFKLEHLDLSSNTLQTFPSDLGLTIAKLAVLNLNHNRIQAIPATISAFSALSVLCAAHNDMSSMAIEVTELPRLTMIDLSNNRLITLPEVKPRQWKLLEKVFLHHNQLTQLPAGYFMLPKLLTLDVEFNKIQTLPPDMSGARQLRHLRVRGNELKHYPLSPVTAPLLRHCDLSQNPIESEALAEHHASTETAVQMDQVRSQLWTLEQDQEVYKQQHQFAEEPPCAFNEYAPLRRLDDCFNQLTKVVQAASGRGMRLNQVIQVDFARLSCMLRKLRYLSDWITRTTAHLRTHSHLEQKDIADGDDTGVHCPCEVTSGMVNDAKQALSFLVDAACRLFQTVGEQIECTELPSSQFVEFHLGFAICLQTAGRHGMAMQHLQLAVRRHHALPLVHVALLRSQLACGQYRQAVDESRRILCDFSHLLPPEVHDEVTRLQAIAAEGCQFFQSMGCSSAPLLRGFNLRADDVWEARRCDRNDENCEFKLLPATSVDQLQLSSQNLPYKHHIDHTRSQCNQARQQLGLCRAALETHSRGFDTGRSSLRPRTASA